MRRLLRNTNYRRWKYMVCFSDNFLILGFVVLLGGIQWMTVCLLRFGPMFPQDIPQAGYTIAQDVVGLLLCALLTYENLRLSYNVLDDCHKLIFLALWFGSVRTPALTDWTCFTQQLPERSGSNNVLHQPRCWQKHCKLSLGNAMEQPIRIISSHSYSEPALDIPSHQLFVLKFFEIPLQPMFPSP